MADISSHSHYTDTLCGRYGVADIDVWPISTLLVADMVFCVADMVVADIVCGRYRRFPYWRYHYAPPHDLFTFIVVVD